MPDHQSAGQFPDGRIADVLGAGQPAVQRAQARDKGLVLNGLKLEAVTIGENGITEADILVHDAKEEDPTLHQMLVRLETPVVTGVIRAHEDKTLEDREDALTQQVKSNSKFRSADDLFYAGDTYEVN